MSPYKAVASEGIGLGNANDPQFTRMLQRKIAVSISATAGPYDYGVNRVHLARPTGLHCFRVCSVPNNGE